MLANLVTLASDPVISTISVLAFALLLIIVCAPTQPRERPYFVPRKPRKR